MNLKKIKTEGIYFCQSDMRENGYYTKNKDGTLHKHKFEISFKDKMNFLIFNKKLNQPISTRYIYFNFYENELIVRAGGVQGDAISVAKLVKDKGIYDKPAKYEVKESSIIIHLNDSSEELEFNSDGENTSRKLKVKENNITKFISKYSYLKWNEI